eukprot:9499007-Pyramimonas_sp.AAC.1
MAPAKMPDEILMLTLLEAQLRKSRAPATAFAQHDAAGEGPSARTSTHLHNAAQKEAAKKQRAETQQGLM